MASLTAISHLMQVNSQLDELRAKLNEPIVPLTNDAIFQISSQLQPLYKKLLITNLDDGLSRQMELGLWTDCFKTPLTRFGRTDKTMFHLMIETGVGFYLGLIQDIGVHFDISFITNATSTNKLYCTKTSQSPLVSPSKTSVYYIIQNCLLHVGDLLRYRSSFPEALKMYDKASAVCPSNGFPHHQMGITQLLITATDEYTTMNNLVSSFYYFSRSLAVANPHLPAYNAFDSIIEKVCNIPVGTNKYQEFVRQFLLMIASILRKDTLPKGVVSNVLLILSPLVTNQQIKPSILFQMICIAIWTHWRLMIGSGGEFCSSEETILELISSILNAILISAVGLVTDDTGCVPHKTDRRFTCSVHLKLLLDWIVRLYQNDKTFKQVRFIQEKVHLSNLCKVLNVMKKKIQDIPEDGKVNYILPEEKRLMAFLPLDFTSRRSSGSTLLDEGSPTTQDFRLQRILNSAIELTHPHSSSFIKTSTQASSEFAFLLFDGEEFTDPFKMSGLSPVMMPNRRNVALTSIFRSGLANTASGGNARNLATAAPIPSFDFGDANSSFSSSVGGISPSNSATSLSPMTVPFSNSFNTSSNSGNALFSVSGHTTPRSDPFRSIWTPDNDKKLPDIDTTWN